MGDSKFTDLETSLTEQAATNAEERYVARERGLRAYLESLQRAYGPDAPPDTIEDLAREIHATPELRSLPVRQPIVIAGLFRVYFNRHQAAPLVWSIALEGEGDVPALEIAVADVVITSAARTVYAPKATPDDEDGRPSAWLEVDGVLHINPNSRTARIE